MKRMLGIVMVGFLLSILAGLPALAVGPDSTPPVVYAFGMSASAAKTVDCAGSAAIMVQAKASDLNGIKAMTTQIKRPGDATWSNFAMAKKPDGYWRYYIPKSAFTRPYVGIWQVRVVAYDTFNNSTKSGIKTINVSTCPDTAGPVIGAASYEPQLFQSPCPSNNTDVTVSVTDGNGTGIAEVTMYYMAPGASSYSEVTMVSVGGNNYRATLGPFASSGTATFYIEAYDLAGNEAESGAYYATFKACV